MKHTAIVDSGNRSTDPRLLHEFFERQAKLRPEHPAVECGGETMSYSQLNRHVDEIAILLRSRGMGPGSLMALYMSKSRRLFAALLGVLKAGAVYVPIDPKFPIGRAQAILNDA